MKKLCFKCGKEKEVAGNSKWCPVCEIFLCDNCGSGRTQCPKCQKYSLR
jgi:hypothetical protein